MLNTTLQKRAQVLGWLEGGRLTTEEAATVLGLSRRQVLRLKAAYRTEGVRAVIHGNSGRTPPHAVRDDARTSIVALARSEEYRGYNHTHLCEELAESRGIMLSRRTLARILRAAAMARRAAGGRAGTGRGGSVRVSAASSSRSTRATTTGSKGVVRG